MKDFTGSYSDHQEMKPKKAWNPIVNKKKEQKAMNNVLWIDINLETKKIADTIIEWLWMNALRWEYIEKNIQEQIQIIMWEYFWENSSYRKISAQAIKDSIIAIWVQLKIVNENERLIQKSIYSGMLFTSYCLLELSFTPIWLAP